jgi:hypothetical protein
LGAPLSKSLEPDNRNEEVTAQLPSIRPKVNSYAIPFHLREYYLELEGEAVRNQR